MGKNKGDFEEELDLDTNDADIDDDDLDLDLDDDSKGGGMLQSTSKRVRMIFSVMASPNRIDILRILNSKGPLTYSELKSLAGFKSKKESGKFAYHLRKLLRQSLVALNKSERRYTITNLGKLVLSLARQIEERSIIESGKMYVRTSHDSIEEFNSHKIIQSLVREGSLPLELSQKITEEVENRIYKFQTTYLTGSLIREMVNNVLLEHGHEEYRNKLARLGMPVFDIQEMFTNVENLKNGAEDLLFKSGKNVLTEYLLTNTLPKDIADAHMAGDIHISNAGLWSVIPDIIFLNLKEFVEHGIQLQGKYLGVTRLPQTKTLDDLETLLSTFFMLISKEASQEIVVDDLIPVLAKYSKTGSEIEKMLAKVFTLSSTSISFDKSPTIISFRIPISTDQKIIQSVLTAYHTYVHSTPFPNIGIIIDSEKGKVSNISKILSEIISVGGNIIFSKGSCSTNGIKTQEKTSTTSITLGSVTINLPRLAFESNKDETYFRARLALLMKPVISSMALRKKDISDLTRRGINPILANSTQFMQRSNVSLVLNLVGLKEAVFNILDHKDVKDGNEILYKVLETAIDIAGKKGEEAGINVKIAMVDSDGISRFVTLDGEKYGKNSVIDMTDDGSYSQGLLIDGKDISSLNAKNEIITECNKRTKILNGGIAVKIRLDDKSTPADIKKIIEDTSSLISSFKPVKHVPICGNCGYKDEKLSDKCPTCKSQYII
ncbi:MAG: anaerobic ribonucleoside-triphosphate reductase [Thermoproteota archaeon]|nr:anaerobic ribonucleoside-triphosphate reductase [Thermoproteota archaeon]